MIEKIWMLDMTTTRRQQQQQPHSQNTAANPYHSKHPRIIYMGQHKEHNTNFRESPQLLRLPNEKLQCKQPPRLISDDDPPWARCSMGGAEAAEAAVDNPVFEMFYC